MNVAAWIDQLEADGPRLAAAAERAAWDAAVPGIAWDVRTVVTHTGAVHRWATDVMVRRLSSNETGGSSAFHGNTSDEERVDWFLEGHATLVETLRAAPQDLDVFTFLRADSPLHFWARRQAHETAIHRVDVEAAAGRPRTAFDVAFAQDGIAEIVQFGRGRAFAADRAATLALAASDGPSWLITFGGERNVAVPSDEVDGADAAIAGTSSELYCWLWNRPADVTTTGHVSVPQQWSRVQVT